MSVYNIERFVSKQEEYYETAYEELKNGKKESHWMWYIFPQLKGLGSSSTANTYAIRDIKEAIEYLDNDYLYNNLINMCKLLLEVHEKDPVKIFGYVDSLKLKSSSKECASFIATGGLKLVCGYGHSFLDKSFISLFLCFNSSNAHLSHVETYALS